MSLLGRKQILSIVVPLFIEQSFVVLLSVVSTFLSSQVSEQAVSAVSVMDGLNQLFTALFVGIGTGATVIMSQYSGRRELQKADECIPQLMTSMVAVSGGIAVITLVAAAPLTSMLLGAAEREVYDSGLIYLVCVSASYPLMGVYSATSGIMRGLGDTRTSMKIAVLMNIVNIAVSSLCIFAFGAGVWGIGIGIISARGAAAALSFYVLRNHRGGKRKFREFFVRPNWELQRMIFKIGLPVSLEGMLFQLGRFMTQIYIIPMGTVYLSSYAVSLSISSVYALPGEALRIAGITLVGMHVGAKDSRGAQRTVGGLILVISGIMAVLSVPVLIFADSLAQIYGLSGQSAQIAAQCLRMYALVAPAIWAISFVPGSVFKAAGDVRYSTIVAIVSMFLVRVTLGYILGVQLKMYNTGVFIAMFADWALRGVLFMIRYFRKTWIKGVIVK